MAQPLWGRHLYTNVIAVIGQTVWSRNAHVEPTHRFAIDNMLVSNDDGHRAFSISEEPKKETCPARRVAVLLDTFNPYGGVKEHFTWCQHEATPTVNNLN
jgi:hypothetical protein